MNKLKFKYPKFKYPELYKKITRVAIRQLGETSLIPHGWGRAYNCYNQDAVIIIPIPFNWVVGGIRLAYYFLMKGPPNPKWQEMLYDVETKAYNKAYESMQRRQESLMREVYHAILKEKEDGTYKTP